MTWWLPGSSISSRMKKQKLEITRISKNIWEADGHILTYDKSSGYISCRCTEFANTSKCVVADAAEKDLKKEGKIVHRPRAQKPIFLEEKEKFKESFQKNHPELMLKKPKFTK